MFKKRRFRKYTIGRIQMLFQKRKHTGYNFFAWKEQNSDIAMPTEEVHTPICLHYKNVTKKKIRNPHNTICKCY